MLFVGKEGIRVAEHELLIDDPVFRHPVVEILKHPHSVVLHDNAGGAVLFDKTAQDDLIDLLRLVQRLDKDVFLIVKPGGVILLLTFLAEKKKGAFLIAVKAKLSRTFVLPVTRNRAA